MSTACVVSVEKVIHEPAGAAGESRAAADTPAGATRATAGVPSVCRHVDRVDDCSSELEVESVAGTVAVHRGEENLSGTERHGSLCPLSGVDTRRGAAPVDEHFVPRRA